MLAVRGRALRRQADHASTCHWPLWTTSWRPGRVSLDRYFTRVAVFPTFVVMVCVFGMPLAFSFYLSFTGWDMNAALFSGRFVGLANYEDLLTHASVFVCPSVYEPLGIVNLEAMACETAVVASAVGGIPEVVADGVTGLLVPCIAVEPAEFEAGLAAAVDELALNPTRAAAMGRAGRERAEREFSWETIAHRTVELYESVL